MIDSEVVLFSSASLFSLLHLCMFIMQCKGCCESIEGPEGGYTHRYSRGIVLNHHDRKACLTHTFE